MSIVYFYDKERMKQHAQGSAWPWKQDQEKGKRHKGTEKALKCMQTVLVIECQKNPYGLLIPNVPLTSEKHNSIFTHQI